MQAQKLSLACFHFSDLKIQSALRKKKRKITIQAWRTGPQKHCLSWDGSSSHLRGHLLIHRPFTMLDFGLKSCQSIILRKDKLIDDNIFLLPRAINPIVLELVKWFAEFFKFEYKSPDTNSAPAPRVEWTVPSEAVWVSNASFKNYDNHNIAFNRNKQCGLWGHHFSQVTDIQSSYFPNSIY